MKTYKIGILGTGDVGQSLGSGFTSSGCDVMMGSRDANNEKAQAWAKKSGGKVGTFADAAKHGEIIALATLGQATKSALEMAGPEAFAGKIVLDATNPLEFKPNQPPALFVGHTDSLGEQVQRQLPKARVVKAFNTVGNPFFYKPELPGGAPDMFIAGNDQAAKDAVKEILTAWGWGTIDLGGIEASRYLEAMCMVWVLHGVKTGSWTHAFKMLHK
jgi:predicted dinucleotide-binding enzyme